MVLKRMFAEGVSSIARFRRWPSDIAVVPVGSSSELPSELAQAAAVSLGVPLLEVFRPPSGPKVKNLPLGSRDRHAADRVVLDAGSACAPNVVLIDDLVESGSTLSAAAKALRGIGAHNVVAIVAVHIHH
jgi:predicted amidophosphoribosyltransferase